MTLEHFPIDNMSTSPQDGFRWAGITPDDYSGVLYVITFLSLTYTSTTVLARVLIRSNVLGVDDCTMVAAQCANIVQFALLVSSLSSGLAKSYNTISNDQYMHMAKTLLAAQIVIYLALGLSKTATVLIVRRLFTVDMREPRRICNIVTGIVVIWTVVSAMVVSVGCSAASVSPRSVLETCPGIRTRYLIVTITDALTDILLTVAPAYLCCRLNMKLCVKLQVLGIFALRLPLIMLSVLFFKHWKHSLNNANPGIARTTPLAYQQCELCISIIVGTIPSLKAFLQSFDTGSGVKADLRYTSNSNGDGRGESSARCGHRSPSSRQWDSYQMKRLDRTCFDVSPHELSRDDGAVRVNKKLLFDKERREESMGESSKHRDTSSDELDRRSHRSTQELIIKKHMQWEVTSETRRGNDVNTPGLLRLPM